MLKFCKISDAFLDLVSFEAVLWHGSILGPIPSQYLLTKDWEGNEECGTFIRKD